MSDRLCSPIIVVGTGRCGSTIFFEALSRHEHLGWLTNYDASLSNSKVAQLTHYLRRSKFLNRWLVTEKLQNKAARRFGERFLIRPVEGYAKWNLLCDREFGKDYLDGQIAAPEVVERIRGFFRSLLRRQGKSRLLIKVTGPTRICFLNSVFPDAKFVHVIRDPCAVASSLMRTSFWQSSLDNPRWQNGLPSDWESEWEQYDRSPLALTAIQYRTIMEICCREIAAVGEDRYWETTYKAFVENPVETTSGMSQWAGLPDSPRVLSYIGAPNRYRNMNHKFREFLSAEEIKMIRKITASRIP